VSASTTRETVRAFVLLSAVLVCVIALATATVVLLAVGVRVRVAAALVGPVLAALVSAFAGVVATRLWSVPVESIWDAGTVLTASALVISLARPRWNPVAQAFAGIAIGSSLVYLAFGAIVTFASGLSAIASIASGLLLILEAAALTLSDSFAFESVDVLCTPHPVERPFGLNPLYRPMVSLQVAAYNEPPDMLIETIRSLEAIDYPNFEVVVIDNNTKDPAVWQPVADYCEGRNRVRFVHVDDWPGYTSGALNLVLAEYTHPDAELIGVIDADYLVDPSYLSSVVGYFHDPDPGRRRLAVALVDGRLRIDPGSVPQGGGVPADAEGRRPQRRPDRGVDRQDRIADRAPALGGRCGGRDERPGEPAARRALRWQGAVYASSPYMAWLNQHTELIAQLERRRRSEYMRDRVGRAAPMVAVGTMLAGVAVAAVLIYGGSHPGPNATNPFDIRQATGATSSVPPVVAPVIPSSSGTVVPVTPSPTVAPSPSVPPSSSVTPSSSPSASPTVVPSTSIPPTTSIAPAASSPATP